MSGVGLQTAVCVGEKVQPHHVTAGLSTEVVGAGGVRWQGVSGADHVTCPPLGPSRVVQVGVRCVHPELTPGGQQIQVTRGKFLNFRDEVRTVNSIPSKHT